MTATAVVGLAIVGDAVVGDGTVPDLDPCSARLGPERWQLRLGVERWPLKLGAERWAFTLTGDRWPVRLGVDRWGFRLGKVAEVRSASKQYVEVQIKPPVDLTGLPLRFCTNTVNAVPVDAVWADLLVPEGTVWTPGEWSTVLALVGPDLTPGSLFIIPQITALPEIVVEVAGYREVLA